MAKSYRIDSLRVKIGKLISYLLLFAFVVTAFSIFRNISTLSKSKLRVDEAAEKVEKLRKENEELERKKEISQSIEFKEQQIRDKLSMAKEGEIIVVLPDPEIVKKFAQPKHSEPEVQIPNWRKWVDLFL